MPWLKVDDTFPSHPKVRSIPRRTRMSALGVWLACGAWSGHHLTDGSIPHDVVEDEGGKQADAKALVDANLWHSNGHDCSRCPQPAKGDYQFHDWLDWQPARDEVLAKRTEEAQRKAAWRAQKAAERRATQDAKRADVPTGQTPDGQRDTARTDSVSPAGVQPSRTRPDPTRPDPLLPTEEARGLSTPADEPPRTTQTLVGEWIDNCAAPPPSRVKGQIAKEVAGLLAEGIPYSDVRRGLQAWQSRSLHPSTLASVVHEVRNPPQPRQSTTATQHAALDAMKDPEPAHQFRAIPGGF